MNCLYPNWDVCLHSLLVKGFRKTIQGNEFFVLVQITEKKSVANSVSLNMYISLNIHNKHIYSIEI